jgi:hypothetical protein
MTHGFDHSVREPVDLFIGQTVGRYALKKAGDYRRAGLIALQGVGQTLRHQPFQLPSAEGSRHMDHRHGFPGLLSPASRRSSDQQGIECVSSVQIDDGMPGQGAINESL